MNNTTIQALVQNQKLPLAIQNSCLPITRIWVAPADSSFHEYVSLFQAKLSSLSDRTAKACRIGISKISALCKLIAEKSAQYLPIVKRHCNNIKNIVISNAQDLSRKAKPVILDIVAKTRSCSAQLVQLAKGHPTETVAILSAVLLSGLLVKLHHIKKALASAKQINAQQALEIENLKSNIIRVKEKVTTTAVRELVIQINE